MLQGRPRVRDIFKEFGGHRRGQPSFLGLSAVFEHRRGNLLAAPVGPVPLVGDHGCGEPCHCRHWTSSGSISWAGPLWRLSVQARPCRIMTLLLDSRVPVLDALELAGPRREPGVGACAGRRRAGGAGATPVGRARGHALLRPRRLLAPVHERGSTASKRRSNAGGTLNTRAARTIAISARSRPRPLPRHGRGNRIRRHRPICPSSRWGSIGYSDALERTRQFRSGPPGGGARADDPPVYWWARLSRPFARAVRARLFRLPIAGWPRDRPGAARSTERTHLAADVVLVVEQMQPHPVQCALGRLSAAPRRGAAHPTAWSPQRTTAVVRNALLAGLMFTFDRSRWSPKDGRLARSPWR